MKILKTNSISQNKFVNKYDIISHLYENDINIENETFNIIENHQEAYGVLQYQIIEISEKFYKKNEEKINKYYDKTKM